MPGRKRAQERPAITGHDLRLLPAVLRPVGNPGAQRAHVDDRGCEIIAANLLDEIANCLAVGGHALMPVGGLIALALLGEHRGREAIRQRRARQRPADTILQQHVERKRKAEFDEPPIGSGVALVDAPAGQRASPIVAEIIMAKCTHGLREIVIGPAGETDIEPLSPRANLSFEARMERSVGAGFRAPGEAPHPIPDDIRDPGAERIGGYASQPGIAGAGQGDSLAPPSRPAPLPDQIRQQRVRTRADRPIAILAGQEDLDAARLCILSDRGQPDEVAKIVDGPIEQRDIIIEARDRRRTAAAQDDMVDIVVERRGCGGELGLVGNSLPRSARSIAKARRRCVGDDAPRALQKARRGGGDGAAVAAPDA